MPISTYGAAGVNRSLGDAASKILYGAAKETWNNRQGRFGEILVPFDNFSGLRAMDVSSLPPGSLMNMGFDGVGTKIEVAERMNRHDTIAFDLFAMVCDDAVIRGAEPVLIGSILDVRSLSDGTTDFIDRIESMANGYVGAAQKSGVAVVNGELAELGPRVGGYGGFCYNWGASVLWFAQRDRILTGLEIAPGYEIVALREKGFRSNGLSLVRKVLSEQHGEDWHTQTFEGRILGDWVLEPSVIYSQSMVEMTGGFEGEEKAQLLGAAHITGGGIPGKLGRLLRAKGFGATLTDLFAPNPLMLACQEYANISDAEAYETWNMGQGMMIVTPDIDAVIKVAETHQIEAKVVGHITEAPEIRILSQGTYSSGKELFFRL